MKVSPYLFCVFILISIGCSKPAVVDVESVKKEVLQAEADFNKMAADSGVAKAFLHFASEDAVLMRGNKLVKGKNAMRDRFAERAGIGTQKMHWIPEFVDVAQSGELAYTFGTYYFNGTDSSGVELKDTGIFHTVWKKLDGQWKFVYD